MNLISDWDQILLFPEMIYAIDPMVNKCQLDQSLDTSRGRRFDITFVTGRKINIFFIELAIKRGRKSGMFFLWLLGFVELYL